MPAAVPVAANATAPASPVLALPSLSLALAVFGLYVLLELLQRWVVLRPVRHSKPAAPCDEATRTSQPTHAARPTPG